MIDSSNCRVDTDDDCKKHKPSCRPPRGKTYLTIGQDFFSIQEYLLSQYNASLHRQKNILPLSYFQPACTMTYTDIYQLKGFDHPADYGSGVEYAKGLAEAFPESGLQVGLWLSGSQGCQDIVSGALNDTIYRLFDFVQSELPESLPKVFLRVGYEFDNPWFGYSDDPEGYQEAFRTLVRACETQMTPTLCHEKIVFVWHSWAAPRKSGVSLDQFYPGDYYVDWIGISIFQQLYPWANDVNENEKGGNFAGGNIVEVREVLEFAKARDKPTMIAESTPFGGMDVTKSSVARKYSDGDVKNNDIWNLWFQKTIDLIDEYDISMWSYINCDWGSQPMWQGTGFGDSRLSSSDNVMSHWWDQVLSNNTRFLLRIGNCDDQFTPGSGHDEDLDEIYPYQQLRPKSTALSFQTDSRGIGGYLLSNRLPYTFYTGGLIFMALLSSKIFHWMKRRHSMNSSTRQSFDLLDSNSRGIYGSLE